MTTPNQAASPAMLRSMELTPDELRELKSRATAGYLVKRLVTGGGDDGLFTMQTRRELAHVSRTAQAADRSGPDINNLDISLVPNSDHIVLSGSRETFIFLRGAV